MVRQKATRRGGPSMSDNLRTGIHKCRVEDRLPETHFEGMNFPIFFKNSHCVCRRLAAFIFALLLISFFPFAKAGLVDEWFDFTDNAQKVANKSVEGYMDAARAEKNLPPPEPRADPFSVAYLQEIQLKNEAILAKRQDILKAQHDLLDGGYKILSKLPADPNATVPGQPKGQEKTVGQFRAEIEAGMKQVASNYPHSLKQVEEAKQALANATTALERRKALDPNYSPTASPEPKLAEASPAAAPEQPAAGAKQPQSTGGQTTSSSTVPVTGSATAEGEPPQLPVIPPVGGESGPLSPGSSSGSQGAQPGGPVNGSGTEESHHGGLDALKAKEASLEAEARALGKERATAVLKYKENPTPENKAEAQALKKRVDEKVGELNKVRNRVDSITGTSRGDLKVKTSKQIIENARRSGATAAGPESHHDVSGRDISPSRKPKYDIAAGAQKQRQKANVASRQSAQKPAHGTGSPAEGPNKQRQLKTTSPQTRQLNVSRGPAATRQPIRQILTQPQRKPVSGGGKGR